MKLNKRKIIFVVGTRPEIIRFAPLIREIKKGDAVTLEILHTGQHYSYNMDKIFFEELAIDFPDINLNIGSSTQYKQLSKIIDGCGEYFEQSKPDLVCVWGDTNSSLGAALASNKLRIKLAHLEAGCRSNDFRMMEEYNRILIDHISDILFPLSKNDTLNLHKEKVKGLVSFVGDPLYDVFLQTRKAVKTKEVFENLKIKPFEKIILMTLHRAETVDDPKLLKKTLEIITSCTKEYKLIFAIHPRTKQVIETHGFDSVLKKDHIFAIPPVGYNELVAIISKASLVITDSGGLQKEAYFAKVPCFTLRKSTEWVDTVKARVNRILDPEKPNFNSNFCSALKRVNAMNNNFSLIKTPLYGNGKASKSIAKMLENFLIN